MPLFFASWKPKTTVFTRSFAFGLKITVFTVFFGKPSKNSGMYAVFMLQEAVVPCQSDENTVNYSVLAFGRHQKPSKIRQKVPNGSSKPCLAASPVFIRVMRPNRRENTTREQDFAGVGGRHAKASPDLRLAAHRRLRRTTWPFIPLRSFIAIS
jgi:hypothetical protein